VRPPAPAPSAIVGQPASPVPLLAARPFVEGGPPLAAPHCRAVIAWSMLLGWFLLPVPGLFRGVGSSMEEGFMLVFPRRMLAGDLPNRDFLHLYGPGSLQLLAGWYKVFGYSLESQRVVGIIQHFAVVAALYVLCRPWGYRAAVVAGATMTVLIITPTGVAALAWQGGVAFGLWSVVLGIRALHLDGAGRTRSALLSGVLAGLALSYRPDIILAVGLALGYLAWRGRRPLMAIAGTMIGLIPMWVHLALVGVSRAFTGMVTQPLLDLRPGRGLPRPPTFNELDGALQALTENPVDSPWWKLPAFSASHQLFLWFFVLVAVNLATPIIVGLWIRRHGASLRLVGLMSVALFSLGITGQGVQRPDSTHLAWGSCVSFSLLVVMIAQALQFRSPSPSPSTSTATAPSQFRRLVPTACAVAVLLVVCPFFTFRSYLLAARVSVGNRPGGFEIRRNGNHFYLGNQALQQSGQAAVDQLAALSKPGQRLLVGPADLRRTVYSDVVFYYLFPELKPATYFIEMDPGLADAPGSRLASDVASADWLLLTNFWTGWYEPNDSSKFGPSAPNEVVARQFCLVGNYQDALVLLYQRCANGDGIDPSTIGIGPSRRASFEREKARRAALGH
jgi:Dolichyl-phosphate-mannose-protein mannosyltransferase